MRSARARLRIEHEVGDLERLVGVGERGAAKERAQTSEQLAERERLHHVVICAGVETSHSIGHLVPRGQHQDREGAVAVAQLAAHGQAVDIGHHHVEHDDVGLTGRHRLECLGAVGDRLDLVALEGERAHERLAHAAVVFGEEHVSESGRISHRMAPYKRWARET